MLVLGPPPSPPGAYFTTTPQSHLLGGVQEAGTQKTIPARAPRLLVQPLDALGGVEVHHPADIGLVNAHAKGDGGADDRRVPRRPRRLRGAAPGRLFAC